MRGSGVFRAVAVLAAASLFSLLGSGVDAAVPSTIQGTLVVRWDPTGRLVDEPQFLIEDESGFSIVVEFPASLPTNPWSFNGLRVEVEAEPTGRTEPIALADGTAEVFVVNAIRSLDANGAEEPSPHALDDTYWANLAKSYPEFDPPDPPDEEGIRLLAEADDGEWGPVIQWPHIPVSGANLPDGRILTWASNERTSFPAGPEFTYAAVWDPVSGQFTEINHTGHDMFCGHNVVLEDGLVFVNGGRNHVNTTSVFDATSDSWTIIDSMNSGRWYPTTVALPTNQVFTMIGSWGGPYPELWTPGLGWQILSGIDFTAPILDFDEHYEQNWWPLIHVAPNGKIFHNGPTPIMHEIDTTGLGTLTPTGPLITDWYPKHGATVMYDEGKLLVAGGAISGTNQGSTNECMTIDINGPTPVVTNVASMNHARKFNNAIMLPNGEVLVIGGNTSGIKFDDAGTVLIAEIWSPDTQTWREVAPMSEPRNYHSIALMLPDGRVLSGGGGLCGCNADHQDGQVYTPPYLFDANDNLAPRPVITSSPAVISNGEVFPVSASNNIQKFTVTKMGANTHAVNSDQRYLEVPFSQVSAGQYNLTAHANINVLTPGYYFLWALDVQGVPSEAATLQVLTNRPPTIQHPGDQASTRGEVISLQIGVFDPEGDPLTFDATGLPAGLSIDTGSGLISGTVSAVGTSQVTVTVADGDGNSFVSFAWTVTPGSGHILREWWTGVNGGSVASLLGDPDYPDNPTGRDLLTRLDAPVNWDNNYGQRIRGFVHAPTSGQYRFWIASDEESQLLLSSDEDPANAAVIASVSSGVPYQDWFALSGQESALISLQAGRKYYVEVLHKEANAADHVSVAWQVPGGSIEVVDGTFLSPFDEGFVLRQVWTDIAGTALSAMTGDPSYPNDPDQTDVRSSFEAPTDAADDYGQRMTALLEAPVTGSYRFWIASDDQGSLRLSSDADPANAVEIASVPSWSGPEEWGKFPEQQSALIPLTGGEKYFIEALQKEGGGGDNLAVAWEYPGQVQAIIDSAFVSLYSAPVDNRPTVINPGDQLNQTGDSVSLQIFATDPNEDPLTYSATGLPGGLTIGSSTGLITGTPTAAGNFIVTVTVDDGVDGTDDTVFTWVMESSVVINAFVAPPEPTDTLVDYTAVASGGTNLQYKWHFGDGTAETPFSSSPSISHSFDHAQRFVVTVTVTNDEGDSAMRNFVQAIHEPLTPNRPAVSMSVIYEDGQDRVWNVNPDNDSVSVFDASTHVKLAETPVDQAPRALALAPDGRVWVTNKQSASLSVIDPVSLGVVSTVPLAPGSMPYGIAFDPTGAAGYVTLEGSGELVQFDPLTGAQQASIPVGDHPRHLSVASDGSTVYVSRFVSPPLPDEHTASPITDDGNTKYGGEVVEISTSTLSVTRTIVLQNSVEQDAEHQARGIPNYLGPPVISPDGLSAWVPSKQDNILRGQLRDGNVLTHDSTVRSVSSRIDLLTGAEDYGDRVDHDDGGVASSGIFGRYGSYLFIALEASREVSLIDAYGTDEIGRWTVGMAPQGLAISPDGLTLYVHNFMERTISVHDLSSIIEEGANTASLVATYDTVATEVLTPEVLQGKRLFYDAQDSRLSSQHYMSCASCHNDGGSDGRVWDITDKGEGLRNTISLRGHAGMGQGPLHWSANFDEVQDFEGQIRDLAGGSGLMSDVDFFSGTVSQPLGDPKAGLSADLDALAAYVASLSSFDRSPHRNPDDSLTATGMAGQAVFQEQACANCHSGIGFTDSGVGGLHDIGTLTPASGSRLGGPLTGLDTPTLRGVWNSAPYLHDGSAPTLNDAVIAHQGVVLSAGELNDLSAYLRQVDDLISAAPECFDADADGDCNLTDADDDNDSVLDGVDVDPLDPLACQDLDGDGCDDCARLSFEPVPPLHDAGFDAGTDGFVYDDDPFRGTAQPDYATGAHEPGGGFAGAGLLVVLGGVNDDDIPGMSGGWRLDLNLLQSADLTLTFRYNMTMTSEYEADEYGQVLVSVDGALVGQGGDYIVQINGDGNGGPADTTGWQQVTLQTGSLAAGPHSLVIGGYNNQKTLADEITEIRIDDVLLEDLNATAAAPDPSNDGDDFDADGQCDAGDPDDDDDTVLDVQDSDPFNASVCGDFDADTCEDCVTGSFDPANDGADLDADGLCDAGDADVDNDGALNGGDCAPTEAGVHVVAGPIGATLRLARVGADVGLSWHRGVDGHTSNVYEGTLPLVGDPWEYNELCEATELIETSYTDSGVLAPDRGAYFLVSARNVCGESRIGIDSAATELFADPACSSFPTDQDADGVLDLADNCAAVSNAQQADADGDFVGDACDLCPAAPDPAQTDLDGDAVGDACDDCTDTDGDGFGDPGFPASTCLADNCPTVSNPDQADGDNDGVGNACSMCTADTDGDGVCNQTDNCPNDSNGDQDDADGDGLGDLCDPCPENGNTSCEACPDPPVDDPDGDGVCTGQRTVLEAGSLARFMANTTDPGIGSSWVLPAFDDSSWGLGPFGIGYETVDSNGLIATEVPYGTYSVYTRSSFAVTSVASVTELLLGADYDDGFVVWVNGIEVYRSPEMPGGPPAWDTLAAQHESSNGAVPDYGPTIDLTLAATPALVDGENRVAIGVWNQSAVSSDLILVPWLALEETDNCPGIPNPDQADSDDDGVGDLCE